MSVITHWVLVCVIGRCTGEQHLKAQGIDYSTWGLWENHVALIVMTVIFLSIAYVKLRFMKKFTWSHRGCSRSSSQPIASCSAVLGQSHCTNERIWCCPSAHCTIRGWQFTHAFILQLLFWDLSIFSRYKRYHRDIISKYLFLSSIYLINDCCSSMPNVSKVCQNIDLNNVCICSRLKCLFYWRFFCLLFCYHSCSVCYFVIFVFEIEVHVEFRTWKLKVLLFSPFKLVIQYVWTKVVLLWGRNIASCRG